MRNNVRIIQQIGIFFSDKPVIESQKSIVNSILYT